jgi:glycosyltransferase involved in cell wall biosynthesis
MNIGIFHGYELTGSGSNEYTKYLARTFTKQGHNVYIFCREYCNYKFDFINKFIQWDEYGKYKILQENDIEYKGNCILHNLPNPPKIGVYLTDKQRSGNVESFINFNDEELEIYTDFTVKTLIPPLKESDIDIFHTNHLVYQPIIAAKLNEFLNVPFIIFPHGSSIEYTIKKDNRFKNLAIEAIKKSKGLIIGNEEVRNRIINIYLEYKEEILAKTEIVNVGVDTSLFKPVDKKDRKKSIDNIINKGPFNGKSIELKNELYKKLDKNNIFATKNYRNSYNTKEPDSDLELQLKDIPWDKNILIFVGALTVGKGIQSLITSMPFILKKFPDTHLLVIGSGAYREVLEGYVHIISSQNKFLLNEIVNKGKDLDNNELKGPWTDVKKFLENKENLDNMFKYGESLKNNIHFLGRMDHELLHDIFPCADLALFPSIIPEAYPLVLMESLSNGVLPLVSYFSGFKDGVDNLEQFLGTELVNKMKFSVNDNERIEKMIKSIINLLNNNEMDDISIKLRDIALNNYDWNISCNKMIDSYTRFSKVLF